MYPYYPIYPFLENVKFPNKKKKKKERNREITDDEKIYEKFNESRKPLAGLAITWRALLRSIHHRFRTHRAGYNKFIKEKEAGFRPSRSEKGKRK